MVGPPGLEPGNAGLGNLCSIHLSYGPGHAARCELPQHSSGCGQQTTTVLLQSRCFEAKGAKRPQANSAEVRRLAGGAGESRTPDTQFRKLLLYPSELQPLDGVNGYRLA